MDAFVSFECGKRFEVIIILINNCFCIYLFILLILNILYILSYLSFFRVPATTYAPSQVQVLETAMIADPVLKKNMVRYNLIFKFYSILFMYFKRNSSCYTGWSHSTRTSSENKRVPGGPTLSSQLKSSKRKEKEKRETILTFATWIPTPLVVRANPFIPMTMYVF